MKQKQEACDQKKAVEDIMNRTTDPEMVKALDSAFDPLGVFRHIKNNLPH